MVWVLGIALVGAAVAAVRNPFIGLLGLLAINIVQPGEIYPIFYALHAERIMALWVLLLTLVHRGKLSFPPLTRWLLVFWLATFVSVPFAYWKMGALRGGLEFGKIVIYHLLIVALVTTEERFRAFLVTLSVLTGWLVTSSFYEYLSGNFVFAQGIERAVGLTSVAGDPNRLGLTLVSGLPLMVVVGYSYKGLRRVFFFAIALLAIACIIVTGSRTAFFSLLLLGGVFVLFSRRMRWIPVIAILALLVWTASPEEYQQRYLSVFQLQRDASYQNRIAAWRAGWEMFKDHPLTGVGSMQFPNANGAKYWPNQRNPVWLNAHSLYFQVLGELGLLGTLIFLLFVVNLLRTNKRLGHILSGDGSTARWLQAFPLACTLSLVVLLFAGYSSHNLYRSTWYLLAGLSASLYAMASRKLSPEERSLDHAASPSREWLLAPGVES